jgi:hypothetical protein
MTRETGRAGCHDLTVVVQDRVKPRVHFFGHIHEDAGDSFDCHTLHINGSNLNVLCQPAQKQHHLLAHLMKGCDPVKLPSGNDSLSETAYEDLHDKLIIRDRDAAHEFRTTHQTTDGRNHPIGDLT